MTRDMSASEPHSAHSILDTDLYKLTMQAAVLQHYPHCDVSYNFTNRSSTMRFSPECVALFRRALSGLSNVHLRSEERKWLEQKCTYFPTSYLDFLETFRFRPSEHVTLSHDEDSGQIALVVHGKWVDTILYEVPLLALLSESYFLTDDTRWDMRGQRANAYQKAKRMFEAGCKLSEFGTRRRRSYVAHRIVMEGTSNVHFAHLFDLTPIGTVAHVRAALDLHLELGPVSRTAQEWIMGTAAMTGYEGSNGRAMERWESTYPGYQLSIALTDTFSTGPFWHDFARYPERARKWTGVRQDSGDPFAFAEAAASAYRALGVDPQTKIIVFSDSLDPDKCIKLHQHCQRVGVGCSFGVGTNLSNDFKTADPPDIQEADTRGSGDPRTGSPSKPLNIVIKLATINGEPCVKISDELEKNTGRPDAIAAVKHVFGLDKLESKGQSSFGDT